MSVLVQELVDYTTGVLDGKNGGSGWTAAWETDSLSPEEPLVASGNLSYTGVSDGSPSNNCKIKAYNEGDNTYEHYFSRTHDTIPNTVNGAVYWLAFTMASNLSKGASTMNLLGLTTDGSTPANIAYWTTALADAIVKCNGVTLYTGSSSYTAHSLVYKLTMSGDSGTPIRVDVYCDVDLRNDPSTWTAKTTITTWYCSGITRFKWQANTAASSGSANMVYVDNIRWATTSYEAGGNSVPAAFTTIEELFDYTAQDLHGLNGGTGWTGAWVTDQSGTEQPRVVANNLTYSGTSNGSPSNASQFLVNNEGSGTTEHDAQRTHSPVHNINDGDVRWLAFNIASYLAKGDAILKLFGLADSAGGADLALLAWDGGLSSAAVAYKTIGGTTLYTGTSGYVAHNIICKFTMSGEVAGACRLDIYVDEDLNTDPSGWTPVVTDTDVYIGASGITGVRFEAGTAASSSADDYVYLDNYRWALTSYGAGGYTSPSGFSRKRGMFQFFKIING